MKSLLLSLQGRIGPSDFWRGALFLFVAGFFVFYAPQVDLGLSLITFPLQFLILYCWVALWTKRYHDADKSGAHCLIPMSLYFLLIIILAVIYLYQVSGDDMARASELMQEQDFEGGQAIIEQGVEAAFSNRLPVCIIMTIAGIIIAAIFNRGLKTYPNRNEYGPVPPA